MRVFLSAFLVVAALGQDKGHPSIKHSFRYGDKPLGLIDNRLPFWNIGAGAVSNMSAGAVRLTPQHQSRTGFLWGNRPCTMTAWEVNMGFKMSGLANYGGDGFAFWFAEQPAILGNVFGSIDYWNGLGIFFDTYNNDGVGDSPLISAMWNDGTQRHNSGDDGEAQALGTCTAAIRNTADPVAVKIIYENGQLSLSLRIGSERTPYKDCFKIAVMLGTDKYFGLTAHTGSVADSHDITDFLVYDYSSKNTEELDVVRDRYTKKVETEHQKTGHGGDLVSSEFKQQVLTLLNQMQSGENLVEESQLDLKRHVEDLSERQFSEVLKQIGETNLAMDSLRDEVNAGNGQAAETANKIKLGLASLKSDFKVLHEDSQTNHGIFEELAGQGCASVGMGMKDYFSWFGVVVFAIVGWWKAQSLSAQQGPRWR